MKCIIDTNVPVKASYSLVGCKSEELEMVGACIEFIHELINNPESKLVLDMDREIVKEYGKRIRKSDVGRQFFRWLCTYMNKMDVVHDMVKLECEDGEYSAFPKDKELEEFDHADGNFHCSYAGQRCFCDTAVERVFGKIKI